MRAGQIAEQAVRVGISPRISALIAVGDRAGASRIFLAVTRAVILLAWPFYLTLIVHGEVVLDVFGPGFRAGGDALAILAVGMMLVLAAGTVQTILLMGGRSRWQMGNKAVAVTISVVGSLTLVPRLGVIGSALAWSTALLVDAALASWQVRRGMGVAFRLRALALAAGLPVLTFGVGGYLVRSVAGRGFGSLAISVLLCGVLHLALCWRLRRALGIDVVLPARSR